MLESINLDDEIGHLFVVDIEFDEKNTTERQLLCNEIFPPITEKQIILESNERSLFQHLKQFPIRIKTSQNLIEQLKNHI